MTTNGKLSSARSWLDLVATVLMILTTVAILWTLFRNPGAAKSAKLVPAPSGELSIAGAPRRGAGAAVALIEVSDFECPYCGRFARDIQPALDKKYVDTGKVDVVFLHLPLEAIHGFAFGAAVAAECAGQQNKFWPMVDRLFANQKALDPGSIQAHANELGIAAKPFEDCRATGGPKKVRSDMALAKKLGVQSTPIFLIGRIDANQNVRILKSVDGARPVADFELALDAVIAGIK